MCLYLRADGLLKLVLRAAAQPTLPEGVHASAKLVHAPKNTMMPRPSIVCGLYVGVKAVKLQLDHKVKWAEDLPCVQRSPEMSQTVT